MTRAIVAPRFVVAYIKEDKVAPYLEALAAVGVAESDIFRATPRRTAAVDLPELLAGADGLLLTGGAAGSGESCRACGGAAGCGARRAGP